MILKESKINMVDNNRKIELSIIIVSYNTKKMTLECLNSIKNNTNNINYEIILVDNNSTDGSVQELKKYHPEIIIIENKENKGFAIANNQGIDKAVGDYLLLLNSDTLIYDNSIKILIDIAKTKNWNEAIAPILLNKDRTLQKSFYSYPNVLKILGNITGLSAKIKKYLVGKKAKIFGGILTKNPEDIKEEFLTGYVLFACVLINKKIVEKIGGLDEGMHFYHEDCEYGYRMKLNGIKQFVCPQAKIIHLGGGSSRNQSMMAYKNYYIGLRYFFKKHYSLLNWIALEIVLKIYFSWMLIMAVMGMKKHLNLPSNYSEGSIESDIVFANYSKRIKFYREMI